jgi:hypothetical protein
MTEIPDPAKKNAVPPPINPAASTLGVIPSSTATGTSTTYAGVPQDFVPQSGKQPKAIKNPDGTTSYTYYNPTLDANVILQSMDPKLSNSILKELAKKNPNYKPGNGRSDSDISAFGDVLLFANVAGLPWDQAYAQYLKTVPNSMSTKKAPSIRVTSPDDLKAIFSKTGEELLGRKVDPAMADSFVKAYNQMEIASGMKQDAGGTYTAEAAPGTIAEKQIKDQFGQEAQAFKASGFASIMDNMIKQLGS